MSPGSAIADRRQISAPWDGKRVVLGVCGGVAAYKAVQIARNLTLLGATVDVALTRSARKFIAPLSFEGVTGRRPVQGLFSAPGAALHVKLGREADCICVAPATADFIARVAQGRANDLPSIVLLATRAPVLLAPAMNERIFSHPQTQANLAHLETALGYGRVGPTAGPLGVGEGNGLGRMTEPAEIVQAIGRTLNQGSPLEGRRVLVTAGPTREPVDPVRYVGNRSSGKMGYALAQAAWRRGAEVTLVSGPSMLETPYGVDIIRVETAAQMREAVLAHIGQVDVAVHAAAVADYGPEAANMEKIKRASQGNRLTLELVARPDIAAESAPKMKPGSVAVGFALETSDLVSRAQVKMNAKGFDFIVGNSATEEGAGFETDSNRVTIVHPDSAVEELPMSSKTVIADAVIDRAEAKLSEKALSSREGART